tara:strand:+ start:71 stop:502 length:432 start_codon:yes stop_codon:yes gene_type:complete
MEEWRNLSSRPEGIDFSEMSQEEVLIVLWKGSDVLTGDEIPTDDNLFYKAEQAIIKAQPYTHTFFSINGEMSTWYFKKWIEDFNGKKIKTDVSDPRCICPIWYDILNKKTNYAKNISVRILDKKYQRKNINSEMNFSIHEVKN